jgi:kynureninase
VFTSADLASSPNPLAWHYSRFHVADRLLLTGHSHQAWPDVGFEAQQRAWLDAAEYVDEKWGRAAESAEAVRRHWKLLLNDRTGDIALGQNTHELVTRLLSALNLRKRRCIITTNAEFHTIRRQLDRLAEAGVEVLKVEGRPADLLAERLEGSVNDRTAAVLLSSVFFDTAEIVPGLDRIATACTRHGAILLVDAYHHINAVPFDVQAMGLDQAFVTGGGYKYCQLGEGNAFLRVPPDCHLRPVLTGWFAEFDRLPAAGLRDSDVVYGEGAQRFAGATYDPVSHYRAEAVQAFHREHGLLPSLLREVSRRQVALLDHMITALDLDPAMARIFPAPAERRAGFLAVQSPHASALAAALRARGVFVDARGPILRLGPAPYLRDDQLRQAVEAFREAVRSASTLTPPAPRAAT